MQKCLEREINPLLSLLPSNLLAHGNVSIGDLPEELGIGVVQHDVEVLDGMDGLQGGPVLEPDNLGERIMISLSFPLYMRRKNIKKHKRYKNI